MPEVVVIGAGLAGCEAAWQLAQRGISVRLWEQKPAAYSPAHHSAQFAELVCSNSLRSAELTNAAGLLKEEQRRLGSLIIAAADRNRVEAGGALAVDREGFSRDITEHIRAHENIRIECRQAEFLPDGPVIVATGPLTSDGLFAHLKGVLGNREYLHFYDAAAPIVLAESIDYDRVFRASRYDKGTADYLNCPMDRDTYLTFWRELKAAQEAPVHGFEDSRVFEGCMPVEVMARRGEDTLRYGPLKPRGLRDPKTGREPYAVVQLRQDDAAGTLYNLVGFQTHLKFGEQKRVFSLIPGLERAEFVRYGVMHRNTFLSSPQLLDCNFRLRGEKEIWFAGQITGVEGYIESAASGFVAGVQLSRRLRGLAPIDFPDRTATGALGRYVSNPAQEKFQPMNINFGILAPLERRVRGKREKNLQLSARALEWVEQNRADIAR